MLALPWQRACTAQQSNFIDESIAMTVACAGSSICACAWHWLEAVSGERSSILARDCCHSEEKMRGRLGSNHVRQKSLNRALGSIQSRRGHSRSVREISVRPRMRGGPERTRTSNQAVMSRHRGLGGLELPTKRLSAIALDIEQRARL